MSVLKVVFAAGASAVLLALTAIAGAQTTNAQEQQYAPLTQPIPLSTSRVEKNIGAKNVYIFDCNPDEIYEKSHIKGSIHINTGKWQEMLPKDKKNSFLIFYCINRMCTISYEIAVKAIEMGYANVYNMPDGIQGWVRNGHEFEGTGRQDKALTQALKDGVK